MEGHGTATGPWCPTLCLTPGSWEGCLGSASAHSVGPGSNSDSTGLCGKRKEARPWKLTWREVRSRVEWEGCRLSCRRDPGPCDFGLSDSISCLAPYLWSRIKTDLASKVNHANYCNHFYNWHRLSDNIRSVGEKSLSSKHFLCRTLC